MSAVSVYVLLQIQHSKSRVVPVERKVSLLRCYKQQSHFLGSFTKINL